MAVLGLIVALFAFIFSFAAPVFMSSGAELMSSNWRPENQQFGITAMLKGSLILAVISTLAAFPIALGVSCFCLIPKFSKLAKPVIVVTRLAAGIPTVVYAVCALFILVPLVRQSFTASSGLCLLSAIIVMIILIMPTMIVLLNTQLAPSFQRHQLTANSLGMSDEQVICKVILPVSSKALASAAILGFSRAIGDTMIPLMLAGNAAQSTGSLLDSARTLTAHIGLVIATEKGSPEYNSLFAAGFILLLSSLTVTIIVRRLEQTHAAHD
ncbi:PstC family ABC transporter permease [Persicirhabdus sediminis]|uniref:ABC transporter permease subunit n=1 Tax=Persicirhabdus sediminis TaxID=454144 RepID=A0A8J7MD42_9BACT|nr:ABC transporter permease subunit [Persicirhabdus sediminis]MBK1791177.1 ABC transporter permease subunit [Persicirhabdus sediminis]